MDTEPSQVRFDLSSDRRDYPARPKMLAAVVVITFDLFGKDKGAVLQALDADEAELLRLALEHRRDGWIG